MKALVLADLHYSLKQLDWLLRAAEPYDLVILAGDLLDLGGGAERDTQVVVVSRYLARLARTRPVLVCSGNHDADDQSPAGEPVAAWLQELREDGVHVDGEHVRLGGTTVTLCPWWGGPATRADLTALLAPGRPAPGPWIWIHHVPPDASGVSWDGRRHQGDPFLNELIGLHAPDLLLSGHVHQSPFRRGGSWIDRIGETWVFNPGRQVGALPAVIELDLEAATARWLSLAGDELRALDGA